MQAKRQKWVRATILILGAFIFLAFLGLDPLLRSITKRDRLSAVPQEDVAMVVQLFPPHLDENDRPFPAQALLRFRKQMILTNAVYGFSELKEGQNARLTFRVGSSGRVYVDRVEPLTPAKQGSQPSFSNR